MFEPCLYTNQYFFRSEIVQFSKGMQFFQNFYGNLNFFSQTDTQIAFLCASNLENDRINYKRLKYSSKKKNWEQNRNMDFFGPKYRFESLWFKNLLCSYINFMFRFSSRIFGRDWPARVNYHFIREKMLNKGCKMLKLNKISKYRYFKNVQNFESKLWI